LPLGCGCGRCPSRGCGRRCHSRRIESRRRHRRRSRPALVDLQVFNLRPGEGDELEHLGVAGVNQGGIWLGCRERICNVDSGR
jgi:hypothetical protein